MNNKTRINKYTIALAISIVMITSASAATISWGDFDLDAAPGEINLNGTFVEAFNIVSNDSQLNTSTTTINGVTFTAKNLFNNSNAVPFGANTGDANLDLLYLYAGDQLNPITLTDLAIGGEYELQIFLSYAGFKMNVGDGTTIQKTSSGTIEDGAWIIGTFTADATTQNYQSQLEGIPFNFLSGYQLRDISSVPEPSSTVLIGLGGLALILRRRK